MRRCPTCKRRKRKKYFYENTTVRACKICIRKRVRAYNKEHLVECNQRKRKAKLKNKYGITQEQYLRMLKIQKKRCKICTNPLLPPCIDHKERVRALLCKKCNMALGLFNDSPDLLRKAAQYIEEYQ